MCSSISKYTCCVSTKPQHPPSALTQALACLQRPALRAAPLSSLITWVCWLLMQPLPTPHQQAVLATLHEMHLRGALLVGLQGIGGPQWLLARFWEACAVRVSQCDFVCMYASCTLCAVCFIVCSLFAACSCVCPSPSQPPPTHKQAKSGRFAPGKTTRRCTKLLQSYLRNTGMLALLPRADKIALVRFFLCPLEQGWMVMMPAGLHKTMATEGVLCVLEASTHSEVVLIADQVFGSVQRMLEFLQVGGGKGRRAVQRWVHVQTVHRDNPARVCFPPHQDAASW